MTPHWHAGAVAAALAHPFRAAAVLVSIFTPGTASAQIDRALLNAAQTTVQITTHAAEPDKWDSTSSLNGTVRVFKCKPQVCRDPIAVSFTFLNGSVTPPDPKALKKFADVELPKTIRAAAAARSVMSGVVEQIDTLSSTTATLKGHPSALNETRFTRGRVKSVYLETGIIFANPLVIRVESRSVNRKLAQKSLTEFIENMRIVMKRGPKVPQPGSPRPPKTQDL